MPVQYLVGTSGFSYKHWRDVFYPPGLAQARWLEYYAQRFATVELNSTFYRLPPEKTFDSWRRRTPPGFLFAVKASRLVTHLKRLRDVQEPLETFIGRARALEARLGPILYQLPPGMGRDEALLGDFLALLPADLRHVMEFRNKEWYAGPVFHLLRRHNVALCLHDMAGSEPPDLATADFAYVRFHGTTARYAGSYSDQQLEEWARRIGGLGDLRRVYAYFNNDIGGHAVRNAATLLRFLSEK